MSFGKRLRADRRSSLALVAFAAAMSLGATVATPVETPQASQTTQASAPREYTPSPASKRRTPSPVVNRIKPHGRLLDSRKMRRRILMGMTGRENSGRQWVRVRRDLRRGPLADLLRKPAWELARLAQEYCLVGSV